MQFHCIDLEAENLKLRTALADTTNLASQQPGPTKTQQESEEKEVLGKKYRPVLHFAKRLLLVCLWLPSRRDISNKDFAEATIDNMFDPASEWQTQTPSNGTQIQGVLVDMAPYLGAKWDEIMTTEHFWTFVSPVLSAPGSLPSNIT